MTRFAFAAAILLATTPAGAVYKCVIDGRTTYSQRPCADDAQQIDTTPARGRRTAPGQTTSTERVSETAHDLAGARHLRNLDFDIDRTERRIDALRQRMSREMDALRAKKAHANNNLAGATWEQSIGTEMQAVASRYTTDIEAEQRKLDDLRARRNAAQARPQ